MHVVVLGSGVIGTTIAYYLARAGHQVTVLDRQPGPAMETSFANAGEVSPGYSAPWAGPGVPLKAIKWMLMHHSPLVIKPMLDPAMWRWGLSMLRNCTEARYQVNKGRMVRLAEYSRDCLKELRDDIGFETQHFLDPARCLHVFGLVHRFDEAGLLQLDDRALDPFVVEAGQPRAEPGDGQAAVEEDQDQPLALRELVRLLIDLAQPSIGAAIDHR